VRVGVLEKFMAGGDPGGKLWRAGEALASRRWTPEMEVTDIALNILADTFPIAARVRVRKALADLILPALDALQREVAP
jgi:hypothetical protein